MTEYRIRDKRRSVKVHGEKIASSSSFVQGKSRWITFDLYRSDSGAYVVHRVGKSKVFHTSDCENTAKNGLDPVRSSELDISWYPCLLCSPSLDDGYIFPEKDRNFVITCDDARGVLEFLSRFDSRTQSVYYTDVSADLLDQAAEVDDEIDLEYYREEIH